MAQNHKGSGDNVGGNKNITTHININLKPIVLVLALASVIILLIIFVPGEKSSDDLSQESEIIDSENIEEVVDDIVGNWSDSSADKLIHEILIESYSEGNDFICSGEDCTHAILQYYNLSMESTDMVIGVTYSVDEEFECHACPVSLSFFEFLKTNTGWKLDKVRLGVLERGAWGQPPENINLFLIGHDRYAFTIEGSFTSMGQTSKNINIYSYVADQLVELLTFESFLDNSRSELNHPTTTLNTRVNIIKEGTGFYDLELVTKGIENDEEICQSALYKYNGVEYIESDVFN